VSGDDGSLGSAAGTPTLSSSHDGVCGLAAGAIQDLEGSAWALEVPEQAGKSGVQDLEARDPVGDLGPPSLDHAGQFGSRISAVPGVAPARNPSGILQGQIEAAKVDDQAQVLHIDWAIVAVRVVTPTGSREPPRALIEAHRVRRDTNGFGKFTDPHAVSKPWSGSHVKTGHGMEAAIVWAASRFSFSRRISAASPSPDLTGQQRLEKTAA
jgi:hypothetical protein